MPSSILNSDDGVISGTAGLKNSGGDDAVLLIQTKGVTAQTVDAGQRTMFPTTIAVGGATPSTSGSGITFPATQSASTNANTLDDYEEGTWTPVVSSISGFSGSITVSYATYMKIGNTVFIRASYIFAGSSGNATAGDTAILTGLPFAPALQASAATVFAYNDTNGGIVKTIFSTAGAVRNLLIVFIGAASNTRADGGFITYGSYQV